MATYKDSLRWILDHTDTTWLDAEIDAQKLTLGYPVKLPAVAALVADQFALPDARVADDLFATRERLAARAKQGTLI